MNTWDVIIIGGGAAGFFAAINAKIHNADLRIVILEQSKDVLNKVRISGGGRCNVTHNCFDSRTLTSYYPRGQRELLGPFHIFNAKDTVTWFEDNGVKLYTEPDGCMFPVSNSSDSIIQCFMHLARKYHIEVIKNAKVKDFTYNEEKKHKFEVVADDQLYSSSMLMIATGSSPFVWSMLENHGYKIVPPCPSLFTFNLPQHPISTLMGLVVKNVQVSIKDSKIVTDGPLLITHWGLSGPAILKASAWGATLLAERKYDFTAFVDWIPEVGKEEITSMRESMAKKKVTANALFGLPARLWQFLIEQVLVDKEKNWASLSKVEMSDIVTQLKKCSFAVKGKTTFKEEFVTAGGVSLDQINFKTFGSKLHPGLYMAGEVINIDAVTGGFNFQAAWTGGYIAAMDMARNALLTSHSD